MDVGSIISMLRRTLEQPSALNGAISCLQQAVFQQTMQFDSAVEDILRDLAYDLDYFEPDPRVRSEDSALIDENKALAEIAVALRRIDEARQ
jgi:hypothetical protein